MRPSRVAGCRCRPFASRSSPRSCSAPLWRWRLAVAVTRRRPRPTLARRPRRSPPSRGARDLRAAAHHGDRAGSRRPRRPRSPGWSPAPTSRASCGRTTTPATARGSSRCAPTGRSIADLDVPGAEAVDWEDMRGRARRRSPVLGDIGDNRACARTIDVYRVPRAAARATGRAARPPPRRACG